MAIDDKTRTELEAAAFRRLVEHLRMRTDVQNIDLMNLAGFCRNCLSNWLKDADGWTTEGWWNISSRSCETLLRGTLIARYYYIYAIDYDRGGEWSGQAFMCSRDKEFTIRGTEDCLARGYDRTGYFEVDTGEQRAWTVQLTDANEQPAQQRVPGLPGPVGPGGVPGLPSGPPGGTPPAAPGLPPAPPPGNKP